MRYNVGDAIAVVLMALIMLTMVLITIWHLEKDSRIECEQCHTASEKCPEYCRAQ